MLFTPLFGGCKYTKYFLFINKKAEIQHFAPPISSSMQKGHPEELEIECRCYVAHSSGFRANFRAVSLGRGAIFGKILYICHRT